VRYAPALHGGRHDDRRLEPSRALAQVRPVRPGLRRRRDRHVDGQPPHPDARGRDQGAGPDGQVSRAGADRGRRRPLPLRPVLRGRHPLPGRARALGDLSRRGRQGEGNEGTRAPSRGRGREAPAGGGEGSRGDEPGDRARREGREGRGAESRARPAPVEHRAGGPGVAGLLSHQGRSAAQRRSGAGAKGRRVARDRRARRAAPRRHAGRDRAPLLPRRRGTR